MKKLALVSLSLGILSATEAGTVSKTDIGEMTQEKLVTLDQMRQFALESGKKGQEIYQYLDEAGVPVKTIIFGVLCYLLGRRSSSGKAAIRALSERFAGHEEAMTSKLGEIHRAFVRKTGDLEVAQALAKEQARTARELLDLKTK